MRYYLTGILMPLLTLFLFSCKKSPADGGPYTFHNKMSEPVNLSLYKTQDDYTHSRNALLSIRIPAQSNYIWRYTGGDGVFDKDALLYLDWHTDDYNYSNWNRFYSQQTANLIEDHQYKFSRRRYGISDYYIYGADYSNMRAGLINGNEPEVIWKACDVVSHKDSATKQSKWHTLTKEEQNFEISIRKDINIKIKAGNDIAESASLTFYRSHNGEQISIKIDKVKFNSSQTERSGSLYLHPSSDTIIASISGLHSYKLVRK